MPTSIRRPRSRRVSPAVPSKPQDSRSLVQRILDVPHLAQVVPRLAPELLHQVIARCGLDACGELLALATPAQLASVADLDLWRPMRPGLDDTFDASRFGAWLEALLECDAPVAARTVTGLEADLVTAGLAHHVRVFDAATVAPYITTDGTLVTGTRDLGTEGAIELCGYEIVARGAAPLWDAIVDVLRALADEHGEYVHRVMRGCRALSNGFCTCTNNMSSCSHAFMVIVIASVVSYSPNLMAFSTMGCSSIGGISNCSAAGDALTSVDKR